MTARSSRERLLDAAVADIAANGVDGVRTARLAGSVGLSTGALFGYWDSLDELLAGVWTERLREPLLGCLDAAIDVAQRGATDGRSEQLEPSSEPIRTAIADMLIGARRNSALREVVVGDLTGWLDARSGPETSAQVVLAASVVWGACILRTSGLGTATDWVAVLGSLASPPIDRSLIRKVDFGDDALSSLKEAMVRNRQERVADRLQASLIDATEWVVAEHGVAGATVTRIARRAGVDRMALYRRYDGIEDLLLDALRAHIRADMVENDRAAARGFESDDPPTAIAYGLVATTLPELANWRRLRLEAHLVARHQPLVAESLAELVDAALDRLGRFVDLSRDDSVALAWLAVRLYQAAWLGLMVAVDVLKLSLDRHELFGALGGALHALDREFRRTVDEPPT